MFEIFFFFLSILDGGFVGILAALIVKLIFGDDNPLGKTLMIIAAITAGIAYFLFSFWILGSEMDLTTGLIFLFAPLAVPVVLRALVKK